MAPHTRFLTVPADTRRRRAAIRRLRRRWRSGRHRSAHLRDPHGADLRRRAGASSFTFAKATWTQALPDWIDAHVRAFEAIGGVPELVVPDNARTAIVKAPNASPS